MSNIVPIIPPGQASQSFAPVSTTPLDDSGEPAFTPSSAVPYTRARITVYDNHEDKYGSQTAAPNPATGARQAQEGVTIAVDPKVIPYGSQVHIPDLAGFSANGDGMFTAHDTGGAVVSRKASGGNEPVIDVYVHGDSPEIAHLKRDMLAKGLSSITSADGGKTPGNSVLDYQVVKPGPQSDFEPISDVPLPVDNEVSAGRNFWGTLLESNEKAGATLREGATRAAAPVFRALGMDEIASGLQASATDAQVKRRELGELETGNFEPGNPYGPGGELDATDAINPARQQDFSSGVARAAAAVPAVAMAATNPLLGGAYFTAQGGAEGAANAEDTGQSRAAGALKGAAVAGAMQAAFAGMGKVAAMALANRVASPVLRFAAGTALAGAGNVGVDAVVSKMSGGSAIPQTPAEWAQRGLFDLGFAAMHGWGEAKLPDRLAAASKQVQLLNAVQAHIEGNPDTYPHAADTLTQIGKQRDAMVKLLRQHAGLVAGGAPGAGADAGTAGPAPGMGDIRVAPESPGGAAEGGPAIGAEPTGAPAPAGPAPSLFEETPDAATIPKRAAPPPEPKPTTVDQATKDRLTGDYSFPKGLVDFVTPEDAAMVMDPNSKDRTALVNLQVAMKNAERAMVEARGRSDADETGAPAPAESGDESIPFSKQSGETQPQTTPAEQSAVEKLVRDTWRSMGERSGPQVLVVANPGDIPAEIGGHEVRTATANGAVVEAYFVEKPGRNGAAPDRKIVIITSGAKTVADERQMPLSDRIKQLALHEIVHHYGSLGAIFGPQGTRAYNGIVDGLLAHMAKNDPETLAYLTAPKSEGGYGYDLRRADHRAAAAEEYLARQNESGRPASWTDRVYSQIRQLLRVVKPDLQWSNADVRSLLAAARRRAGNTGAGAGAGTQSFAMSDWFKRRTGQAQGADVGSERVQSTAQPLDPITGARDTALADDGTGADRTAQTRGLGGASERANAERTGLGSDADRLRGDLYRSRVLRDGGLAVKGAVDQLAREDLGQSAHAQAGRSGRLSAAEREASQLLRTRPADEGKLTQRERTALGELRKVAPAIDNKRMMDQVDAGTLASWLRGRMSEVYGDQRETQGLEEQLGTIRRLYPDARGLDAEGMASYLDKIAQEQARTGGDRRLRVAGIGGEGAVFRDQGGRGMYKLHPGDVEQAAQGISEIRPGERQPTYVGMDRVPLTEVIRRYARQSSLPESARTHIAGVTDQGTLVTRQPELRTSPKVSYEEIGDMMRAQGGKPISIEGKGREVRNSYAVPDGEGNWLMAIDLKPDNVLRDADGKPRLTDGVLAPITPEVLARNPQLAEYEARNPELQFSQQPTARDAEEAAEDPLKRRQFIQKVKDAPSVAEPIKAKVESLYQPISDKQAVEEARAKVNAIGIERAEVEVLGTKIPTKATNVLGLELMQRLQASGEYDRAAAIVMHIAEGNTSQAQAIQSMALFSRLGAEGVQAYATRVVQQAVATGGRPQEVQDLYKQLENLKGQLAKARAAGATNAVLNVHDQLKAAGWDAAKLADIQQKLRTALLVSIHEPGNAVTKIRGLLIAAGMDRKAADKLATRAVAETQKQAQKSRDAALRQMLRLKQGLPPNGPELDSGIQQRIRQALIDNPGSLWARYRAGAAKDLGNVAAKMADPGLRVQTPALQDFTARLLNQLRAKLPPGAVTTERDAVGMLSEAVNNREKYKDVWDAARRYVADRYRANPQMLDRLDKILGPVLDRPFSENTMQDAIRQTLGSMDTSIRDLLTRSSLDKNVAKQQLVSMIADRTGLAGDQAGQLGQDIMGAWNRAEAKARDAYGRGLFKDPIARVSKGELQKWIEMNNAGLLDDAKWLPEISKKYGLPSLSESDRRSIAALQTRFEQAPDGDAKLVAGARMMDAIHSLVPQGMWAKVNSLRNLAMLLNPKMAVRIMGGNSALMLADTAADTLNGFVIDPMVSLMSGQRARSGAGVMARMTGLAQPWRDFWAGVADGRQQGHTGAHLFADGVAYLRDMGKITGHGINDVSGIGHAFRHVFDSRGMRLLEDTLTVLHNTSQRAFHTASFQASLASQMGAARASGREVLAPTPAMLDQALLDANRSILLDRNFASGMLLKAKQALNVAGFGKPVDAATGRTKAAEPGQFGLGNVILPFAQIPGADIARGIEFSPLGFIKAAHEGIAPLLSRDRPFDQARFGQALSRALIGTGGYVLGAYLAKLGVLSALPDDNRDLEAMRRASGLGGLRVNASELWRRLLSNNWHRPAASMFDAAQDGDVVMSYDWLHPASFTVAAGAQAMAEQRKMGTADANGRLPLTTSAFTAGLLGSLKGIEQTSILSSLRGLAHTVGQRDSMTQAVAEQVTGLPASFVPTVIKELNDLHDNTLRETSVDKARHPIDSAINATLEKMPSFAQKYPPRYDVFGQAMEKYQSAGNTLFNVLLNPAFTSEVKKTPELRELERLYTATLSPDVVPKSPQRTIVVNGQQRELTNQELASYKYAVGRIADDRIRQLLASPAWARIPDENPLDDIAGAPHVRIPNKTAMIAAAFRDASSAAKFMLFGERPKPTPGMVGAVVRGRAIGANQAPNP